MSEEGPTKPRRRCMQKDVDSRLSAASAGSSQRLASMTQIEDMTFAGRIIRVHMENIMCHANQEIRFNERINFISGSNGSGKSAILASLVVGLGEQASVTGRFKSLKDMIKHGESNGRITVQLMNEGCNEYKPDVYGKTITIVRSLSINGGSTYQIKSSTGEVISRKKEELDKICQSLNISVKNPLCVLNQDVARTFLSTTSDEVRYKMFMQATGCREIEETHHLSSTLLNLTVNALKEKKARLLEVERQVAELRKKLEYVQSVQTATKERKDLSQELSWSLVIDQEKAIESIKEEKVTLTNKLRKIETDMKNYQKVIDGINEAREDIKQELQRCLQKKSEVGREYQEITNSLNAIRNQLQTELPSLSSAESKLKHFDEEIGRVQTFMSEMDDRNKENAMQYNRNVERLAQVKKDLATNAAQNSQAELELEHAQHSQQKNMDELNDTRQTAKELKRNIEHKKRQIEVYKDRTDTKSAIFGDFVPRLLEEIKANRNRFDREPVGPLGMHISLKGSPDWGPAVESIIGNLMTAFCCHSDKDYQVLQAIMRKIITDGRNPQVIISQFLTKKHDVSRNIVRASDPKIKTVLEMIDIANVVTFNTLIDQTRVESVLLFEDDECAAAKCTNVENVPRGLRMGVTKGCDKYFPAPGYKTYHGGNRSTRFFNRNADKTQVINQLTNEALEMEQEIERCNTKESELRKKISDFSAFISQTQEQLRNLRMRKLRLEREHTDLSEQVESHAQPLTRVALEDELNTLQKQREACEKQIAAKKEAVAAISERKNDKQEQLDKINSKRDRIQQELSRIEEDLEANENKRKSAEFMRKNADKQVADWKQKLVENGEKEARNLVELEEALVYAENGHPERINTSRTPQEITKRIEEKDSYIRAASKHTGNPEEVARQYSEGSRTLNEKNNALKEYGSFRDFSNSSLRKKLAEFKELRNYLAQDIGWLFQIALTTRGFQGELRFDYQAQHLNLDVQPQKVAEGSARRDDVKTLSGGEKSYSTVSLILSIWRATSMPFVAMDEFDVFMDGVNRKIVMDLLLQYAEETPKKQFIFLTPLDISMVKQSDHCTVFQMGDSHHKRPGERN